MKIELENKDLDILAEKVAKQIEERMSNQAIHDKLNERLKQNVDVHAGYYLSSNTLTHDVKDVVKLVLKDYFSTTNIISNAIADYFNTDSFKKISIKHLENRIAQLHRELEAEQDD
jgi:predicted transcriptional regulator